MKLAANTAIEPLGDRLLLAIIDRVVVAVAVLGLRIRL